MPRKLPPFVERWRDRHGKMRHYFRKAKGARIPLPGPETAEFEAAYRGLSRERIVTGILQPYADRPGAALTILKMLRILIRHANNIGWLKGDPSRGIKRPKTNEVRSMDRC